MVFTGKPQPAVGDILGANDDHPAIAAETALASDPAGSRGAAVAAVTAEFAVLAAGPQAGFLASSPHEAYLRIATGEPDAALAALAHWHDGQDRVGDVRAHAPARRGGTAFLRRHAAVGLCAQWALGGIGQVSGRQGIGHVSQCRAKRWNDRR